MISNRLKQLIKIILPIIFIGYACSITFFTHTHIINGVTIVHSHPYATDDNGNPSHQHTGAEIQLIHSLSTFYVAGAIVLFFILNLFSTKKIIRYTRRHLHIPQTSLKELFCLRPPPIL